MSRREAGFSLQAPAITARIDMFYQRLRVVPERALSPKPGWRNALWASDFQTGPSSCTLISAGKGRCGGEAAKAESGPRGAALKNGARGAREPCYIPSMVI